MPRRTNRKAQKKTTNEIDSISCVDRISDLPKNVTDYILEKLEIKDVVRISVLSKKWKQNWTSLPHLNFGDQFADKYKHCFESVVSRILFQHIGPIPKFSLSLHVGMPGTSDVINPWLCFLSRNGVSDLTLNNMHNPFSSVDLELLILPSHFFSCSELRVLTLCACLFKTPFAFNGFRSLTSFTCHLVTFEGPSFESVISLCPLIQELTLRFCCGLGHVLSIVAPNLRVFVFNDCRDTDYITFKNTQNLSSLSICLRVNELSAKQRKRSYILEFFSCLQNLENLTLRGEYSFQKLLGGVAPKRLPILLYFLKDLKLEQFDFCNLDVISCLLCIIRSSPNLQHLHISVLYYFQKYRNSIGDKFQISNLEQQLDFIDCSLGHLHTIKVTHIYGAPLEMLMIKFLLANSPSLKNMTIHIRPSVAEKALWVSKELLRIRRASPDAEVTLI